MSTSNAPQRNYHHGDLRAALIQAGLKALEATPLSELSLRQLARDTGVSATAVYRHFPDKQALLAALADEGIAQLGEAQQLAAQHSDDPFAATGRTYVRWALANPALFRLIFSQIEPLGETVFGDSLAAQLLQRSAAEATGGDPARTRQLVVQAWALVHGLAMLMLDRQLPHDDELIDRVVDTQTLFPRR